ncbi:g2633 [Coccomyxa elongata]
MDGVVNAIKSLSKDLGQLYAQLQNNVLSQQSGPSLTHALAALDPVQHSLGYLMLLEARGGPASPSHPDAAFVKLAADFIRDCDESQIRVAKEQFVSMCRKLKDHLLLLESPRRAVLPLRTALGKLAESTTLVTPLHADLCQVCVLSKCYSAALPVLDLEVDDVDPKKTAMTAKDFLLFGYYGGLVYTGLRDYSKALNMFLYTLTAPTMVVNAITMAAYKKFVLVSLIHAGSFKGLPKYTPAAVTRSAKAECLPYQDLEKAYSKTDEDLRKAVNTHSQAFQEDGNAGLVKLALSARTMRAIQKLTQTYLTLSLADIAAQVGLGSAAEAEQHILQMIDGGQVFARIDEAAGMVRFLEDPERYDTANVVQRIDAQIQQSIAISGRLTGINQRISCDKVYLNKVGGKDRHNRMEDFSDLGTGAEQMAYQFNP